jgi:murein DD-endopeptidase MepM/ murein hydrolase activator NlpD
MDTKNSYKALLRQSAQRELERLKPTSMGDTANQGVRAAKAVNTPTPQTSAVDEMSTAANQLLIERMKRAREAAQSSQNDLSMVEGALGGMSGAIRSGGSLGDYAVTQAFGVRNPAIEVFSKGGINTGLDIGTPENTGLFGLPGKWRVDEAFSGAKGRGRIGDATNSGYGNSVLITNLETGEQFRFSHLNGLNVKPGQMLSAGQLFAATGATGNVTGPHLDIEYRNARGQMADPMSNPYLRYLLGGGK